MPVPTQRNYRWSGRNRMGQLVRGQQMAQDPHDVQQQLLPQHIRLVSCHPNWRRAPRLAAPVSTRDQLLFTRQLATLLHAGLPLLQALNIFQQGQPADSALFRLAQGLQGEIETGHSLQHALESQNVFSNLYLQMIAAGESAGVLDSMLERLAQHLDQTLALRSRLRSALTYPVAVLVMAVGVVGVILSWVVPAFESIFRSFNAELPALTQGVMALSQGVNRHGLELGVCLLLLGTLGWLLYRFHLPVQRLVDRLQFHVPAWGGLFQKICQVRWARTLSTLVGTGVPLVDALQTLRGITASLTYDDLTQQLREDLTNGQSLTQALGRAIGGAGRPWSGSAPPFSPFLVQMVRVGEESGTLELMLAKAADFHEREVNDSMAAITSLLEPVLMTVMGGLIGGLVIAMYLPLFQLGQIT